MWTEMVTNCGGTARFALPAPPAAISSAEKELGVAIPGDLRTLLAETDGIQGEYGSGLIWSLSRIVEDNLAFRKNPEFRELYMSFDPLLFIADAGNGDQFAFRILNGKVNGYDVYAWDHENDSRTWVAPSLEKYLEWRLTGKIKL